MLRKGIASTPKSVGSHLVQKRPDVSYGRHAERAAREHQSEDLHGDDVHDAAGLCADRHADADFAAPLEDGIVEHTVEADSGEQQCDYREEQA